MIAFDQAMDEHLVETLNGTETFRGRLRSSQGPIASLRHSGSAFASLHFDPIRPAELTGEEKKALELYLARGRSRNPTGPTG